MPDVTQEQEEPADTENSNNTVGAAPSVSVEKFAQNFILFAEELKQIRDSKKDVTFHIKPEHDGQAYTLNFDREELADTEDITIDTNMYIVIRPTDEIEEERYDTEGMVISLYHEGEFPVTINVGVQTTTEPGKTMYLYHINPFTLMLEEVSDNEYVVGDDSIVKVRLKHASSYLLFEEKQNIPEKLGEIRLLTEDNVIVVGKQKEFTVEITGYDISELTWNTTKLHIGIVDANRGRTTVTVRGRSAGEEDLCIYRNGEPIFYTPIRVVEEAEEPETFVYTVVKGDWLLKLARRYNTTLDEILNLNLRYKENPDLIWPGDKIVIPVKN